MKCCGKMLLLYWCILCLCTFNPVVASYGDRLPSFQSCLSQCAGFMQCDSESISNGFDKKQDPNISPSNDVENRHLKKRDVDNPSKQYSYEDFAHNYELSWILRKLLWWDCSLNCNYKCQQFVTDQRQLEGAIMVQFYGKWPFRRILGITEIFLVLFSLGNFYVNWINVAKVLNQYYKNYRNRDDSYIMYKQYLLLIAVSLVGWIFSSIFHTRDTKTTETLDYLGAAAIVTMNFNCIFIRYFELFKKEKETIRRIFQCLIILSLFFHSFRLLRTWDYTYNTVFNLVFGIAALLLWALHTMNVRATYLKNKYVYNNSIQLLPFETNILSNLNRLWRPLSKPKNIPSLPLMLNLWLLIGMLFELWDFPPLLRLLDAHAIWHFFTMFPSLLWFDWNIWDLELRKLAVNIQKVN